LQAKEPQRSPLGIGRKMRYTAAPEPFTVL